MYDCDLSNVENIIKEMSVCFLLQLQGIIKFQVRWLNLHEYQSKKLMSDNDITVQRFQMAESVGDAERIGRTFSEYPPSATCQWAAKCLKFLYFVP